MNVDHRPWADEQRALKLSVIGTLCLALLALGFAYLTNSDAIMFDGVFSLIGFVMSVLTLYISRLVTRPDDELFQFGYAHLEPLLNVLKSLVILIVCALAAVAAVRVMLSGGHLLNAGPALLYATIASPVCFAIALYMKRVARQTCSPLVSVDASGWMIDGVLSGALGLSFLLVFVLRETSMAHHLLYADSVLVVVLVGLSLPVPLGILRENLREVLIMAPPEPRIRAVEERLAEAVREFQFREYVARIQKYGRATYLIVHVVLDKEYPIDSIDTLDRIRSLLSSRMKADDPGLVMDLIFTGDANCAHSLV